MFSDEINIKTSKRMELVNITQKVKDIVKASGISEGIVNVFTRHTTSAIFINENESRLLGDFEKVIEKLIPMGRSYGHNAIDNNADSHLRAMIIGGSQSIPLIGGSLDLGTWQSIFFVEFDGPRRRRVRVTVIGR
ncbi:MAG: YjbQ family protein [Methanobacteriales archaeon]|nr:YjbQ family protein [Methanobacteriales archaeon]MBC7117599.1 YjbQ family protein [Methanobacteriaceae archaeon]